MTKKSTKKHTSPAPPLEPEAPINPYQGDDRYELGLSTTQRRKRIYDLIMRSGHPRAITQRAYARRFGVSQPCICEDIKTIRKKIEKIMGDHIKSDAAVFFESGIIHYTLRDEFDKALPLMKEWLSFLFNLGKLKKAREEIGITITEYITKEDLEEGFGKLKQRRGNKGSDTER